MLPTVHPNVRVPGTTASLKLGQVGPLWQLRFFPALLSQTSTARNLVDNTASQPCCRLQWQIKTQMSQQYSQETYSTRRMEGLIPGLAPLKANQLCAN